MDEVIPGGIARIYDYGARRKSKSSFSYYGNYEAPPLFGEDEFGVDRFGEDGVFYGYGFGYERFGNDGYRSFRLANDEDSSAKRDRSSLLDCRKEDKKATHVTCLSQVSNDREYCVAAQSVNDRDQKENKHNKKNHISAADAGNAIDDGSQHSPGELKSGKAPTRPNITGGGSSSSTNVPLTWTDGRSGDAAYPAEKANHHGEKKDQKDKARTIPKPKYIPRSLTNLSTRLHGGTKTLINGDRDRVMADRFIPSRRTNLRTGLLLTDENAKPTQTPPPDNGTGEDPSRAYQQLLKAELLGIRPEKATNSNPTTSIGSGDMLNEGFANRGLYSGWGDGLQNADHVFGSSGLDNSTAGFENFNNNLGSENPRLYNWNAPKSSFGGGGYGHAHNLFKYSSAAQLRNDNIFSTNVTDFVMADAARVNRKISRKISKVPFKVLDAPQLQDDFYLNLVDWSSGNCLAVGLSNCVYLWSACTSRVTKLCDLGAEDTVTSVSWTQRGTHLAVGTNRGEVQIWDVEQRRKLRTMTGHRGRCGTMAWNGFVLSTGSRDHNILHRDVRQSAHFMARLHGHKQEVCGLKWSFDEQQLASGGNDNKLYIWNLRSTSSVLKFADHQAAVKAIAWSPHQHGLLSSGGGTADRCIRFWNTINNTNLSCVDTGSQVCNLFWSRNVNEIVSTHGYSLNQIIVWQYPSMSKVVTLTGHTYRVLYLALSPDGQTIVTGAGDETLRFWNVFPGSKSNTTSGLALSALPMGTTIR